MGNGGVHLGANLIDMVLSVEVPANDVISLNELIELSLQVLVLLYPLNPKFLLFWYFALIVKGFGLVDALLFQQEGKWLSLEERA